MDNAAKALKIYEKLVSAPWTERPGKCRHCGKPFVWCKTIRGNAIPLNAVPGPFIVHQRTALYVGAGLGDWRMHNEICLALREPATGDDTA